MHGVEWVWLVMVSPFVVSHVDGYGRVERGEEVVGTCERQKDIRKQQKSAKQMIRHA